MAFRFLKASLLALFLLGPVTRGLTQPTPEPGRPHVGKPVRFGLSPQLRDIEEPRVPGTRGPSEIRVVPNEFPEPPPPSEGEDPVVQTSLPPGPPIPPPIVTFDGLRSADNFAYFGFRVIPPDPNGVVGPNHYVEIINILVRVYDKTGTPLHNPIRLSSLFHNLGGECADPQDKGDSIALYDPLADRFILSEFAFRSTGFTDPKFQCIAVSQTGDPLGAYFVYQFQAPNNSLNDYPKFGVWPDAYYMHDNEGGGPGGHYAFDRLRMLAGDPNASFIYCGTASGCSQNTLGLFLPANLTGPPPPAGTPNYAVRFGPTVNTLRIYEFHADFDNPQNSFFRERPDSPLTTAPFTIAGTVPQPPPGTNLPTLSDRLMWSLQYRNFGDHESLVVNHSVQVSGRAGVRYYELQRPLPDGNFAITEQATFAPDDGLHRWMGAAALDNQGNLAVGYSVSSSTEFPSIRYAGRLVTDPPGGLFQGENSIVEGSGVQTAPGASIRWGDYSGMSLDPADECTFWYTTEYYTLLSQQSSPAGFLDKIGAFKFDECTPPPRGILEGTIRDGATGDPLSGALVQTMNGYSRHTDAGGAYSMPLPPGDYAITVSKTGYKTRKATVSLSDGDTTDEDVALKPLPQPMIEP